MSYEVQIAPDAFNELLGLPKSRRIALANRLEVELTENPQQAGTALRGASFREYRVITQRVTYTVVFRVVEEPAAVVQIVGARVV